MWTKNFQMFKLDLEKAEEPEIKLPTSIESAKSRIIPEKLLLLLQPLTVWVSTNCGEKKEMGIPDHLTCLLRNLYAGQEGRVRTLHGTMDWLQIGKGVHQSCILSPAYLASMQSTSCKKLGWMKHKSESRLLGELAITSDMQMTPLLWQKAKRN